MQHLHFIYLFVCYIGIYCVCVCVCACTHTYTQRNEHTIKPMSRSEDKLLESDLPSTIWVPGVAFGSPSLTANIFTCRAILVIKISCWLFGLGLVWFGFTETRFLCVALAALELRDPPASASRVLSLKTHTSTTLLIKNS